MGVQIESSQNAVQDSCILAVKNSDTTHVGESSIMIQGADVSPRNEGTKDNDSSVMITSEQPAEAEKVCDKEICLSNRNSTCVASCLEAYVNVDRTNKMTSREDKTCANSEEGVVPEVQTARNNVLSCPKGKDLKQLHMDKTSEFDPIRQHRHFCPWIAASMSGGAPGWQQTLSALLSGKDYHHSSPACSPSSASMIKVDDPIALVRKLFSSPVAKRMKISRE